MFARLFRRERRQAGVFAILLFIAFLFGGGGAEAHAQNGLIAGVGALALAYIFISRAPDRRLDRSDWLPVGLLLALMAIPLIQLIPLPSSLWHKFAGREIVVTSLGLIGQANAPRPLSLDPMATWGAFTFLLFPAAVFLATLKSDHPTHHLLLRTLIAAAAISGVIGAGQLTLGHPSWLSFFDGPSLGAASGIFANPNHQALLMTLAMVACAVLIRDQRDHAQGRQRRMAGPPPILLGWFGVFFFTLLAFASGARAAVMLLAVALPGALLIAMGRASLLRWAGAFLALVILGWLLLLAYPGTNSLGLRESFRFGEDARYAYLLDILYTLQQYWMSGSGLGSFVTVFTPNETLELASRSYLNHAHNDLLEWLIETGIAGAVFVAVALGAIAFAGYRQLTSSNAPQSIVLGALLMVALVLLHSLVDYPLRTITLASVFALLLGILFARKVEPSEDGPSKKRWWPILALLPALLLGLEAIRVNAARDALRSADFKLLASLAPSHPMVLLSQSEEALRRKDFAAAEDLAVRAVSGAPLRQGALRQLALSREAQNKSAADIWRHAASLGWRDAATQYWAFRQATLNGEPNIAALRAGALLRTETVEPRFLELLQKSCRDPRMAVEFANRLQLSPPWRRAFLTLPADADPLAAKGISNVLTFLAARGEANRADGRSLIAYQVGRKEWAQAIRLDDLVSRRRETGDLLDDGGFNRSSEDYAKDATPFDWQVRNGSHASATIETTPPSRLIVDSDGEAVQVAAERYLALPSGQHVLSFTSRAESPEAVQIRVVCPASSLVVTQFILPRSSAFDDQALQLEIPAGCPVQRLLVESLPSGTPSTAELDEFKIL